MDHIPQVVKERVARFSHGTTLLISNTEQGVKLRWGGLDPVEWVFDRPFPEEPAAKITLIDGMIGLIESSLADGLMLRLDNIYHATDMQHLSNFWNAMVRVDCLLAGVQQEMNQPWTIRLQVLRKD